MRPRVGPRSVLSRPAPAQPFPANVGGVPANGSVRQDDRGEHGLCRRNCDALGPRLGENQVRPAKVEQACQLRWHLGLRHTTNRGRRTELHPGQLGIVEHPDNVSRTMGRGPVFRCPSVTQPFPLLGAAVRHSIVEPGLLTLPALAGACGSPPPQGSLAACPRKSHRFASSASPRRRSPSGSATRWLFSGFGRRNRC